MRFAERGTRDIVDLPNLSRPRDDIRGVADKFQRRRPVQTAYNCCEGSVGVDLDQRAGIWQSGRSRREPGQETALGKPIHPPPTPKWEVYKKRGACSHNSYGPRGWIERHDLAVLRQVR